MTCSGAGGCRCGRRAPEFKADAVALFKSDPALTIAQVARDLRVNGEKGESVREATKYFASEVTW
jgi:transposase-like protein